MNELYAFAIQCGFSVSEIIPDGKIHRFKVERDDDKESGFYIFFQNFLSGNAQTVYAGIIGSWQTGEWNNYTSSVQMSAHDRDLMKKKMKEAQKKAEAEKAQRQEATATEVQARWAELHSDNLRPRYFEKKQITEMYGARAGGSIFGIDAYIPMVDVEGKLWNLQKIQSDDQASKYFYPGGRVSGCFHVVGELGDTVYIAEGFATAVAVHVATERGVIAAFNAGNLEPVARELKRKFPEKAFVICGDEDLWTDGNPGRTKAEEAAKAVLGTAVFPKFEEMPENGEKGPSDFDDLLKAEGAGAVKAQVLGIDEPERHFVVALGYDHGNYYLTSNINQQIQAIQAGSMGQTSLKRIQSQAYWESVYPGAQGCDWNRAVDHVMQSCHAKGIFRPEHIRGRGVWLDEGRTVYHMGDALWVNGKVMPLHTLKSRFIYDRDQEMPRVSDAPLNLEECSLLGDVAALLRFTRPNDFMLFAGWIVIAPVCGALSWRPHLWLSGLSGSGKSWVQNNVVRPLLTNRSHFFTGQTTEAGVRQKTGVSTLPVLFDEFETNDERSSERVKAVLELARQSSSDSDAIVAKGGSNGEAMEFRPRFSLMASSVRTNLGLAEDENRFCQLELKVQEEGPAKVAHLTQMEALIRRMGPDYGARLFARTLTRLDLLLENQRLLQARLASRFNSRLGQQVGTLLAGWAFLTQDEPLTGEQADRLAGTIQSASSITDETDDPQECFDLLMHSIIPLDGGARRSIGELITDLPIPGLGVEQSNFQLEMGRATLERFGIAFDEKWVYITTKHAEIQKLYRGTRWVGGYDKTLIRLAGANRDKPQHWFPRIRANLKTLRIPR